MIDARIPLMAQGIDSMKMLSDGSQIAQYIQQQKTDGELNRIHQEGGGNLTKMLELGQQSKLSRFVMPHLQAQQGAQNKALQDRLKAEADIAKTSSEAFKNNQQGSGYGLDNSQKLLSAADRALMVGSQNGDPMAVKLALNNALKAGAINPEIYNQYAGQVDILATQPDALKNFAGSIVFSNAKDPAALLYPDANTTANNVQSDVNNQRTTNASMYSTDVSAETANKNRDQEQQQFGAKLEYQRQQDEIKNNAGEIKEFGGKAYVVYKDGTYRPAVDANGQHISSNKETTIQGMDRQAKVENFKSAATSATDAANLATKLSNDVNGLNKTAGGWGVMAKIPGTDARNYATQIETLQSQVFLNQVEKMRGLGALTDFEGKKLETAIASLDINLEPQKLKQNLVEISRIMNAAAEKSNKMAQIYSGQSDGDDMFGFFNK